MHLRRFSQLGNKEIHCGKHYVSEMSTLSERGYRKRVPVLPYTAPVSIDGPAPSPGSSRRNLTPLRETANHSSLSQLIRQTESSSDFLAAASCIGVPRCSHFCRVLRCAHPSPSPPVPPPPPLRVLFRVHIHPSILTTKNEESHCRLPPSLPPTYSSPLSL